MDLDLGAVGVVLSGSMPKVGGVKLVWVGFKLRKGNGTASECTFPMSRITILSYII